MEPSPFSLHPMFDQVCTLFFFLCSARVVLDRGSHASKCPQGEPWETCQNAKHMPPSPWVCSYVCSPLPPPSQHRRNTTPQAPCYLWCDHIGRVSWGVPYRRRSAGYQTSTTTTTTTLLPCSIPENSDYTTSPFSFRLRVNMGIKQKHQKLILMLFFVSYSCISPRSSGGTPPETPDTDNGGCKSQAQSCRNRFPSLSFSFFLSVCLAFASFSQILCSSMSTTHVYYH